ncbi:3-oxoacyl-[acyl-carrier-protein] reductase FabG [compost metagenome]
MDKSLFNLEGKNVILTGATSHLGVAMSKGLAAHGANIAVVGRNEDKTMELSIQLTEAYGGNHRSFHLDIAKKESIKNSFEEIISQYTKVDILINNASYSAPGRIETIQDEDWLKGIDGTINSVYRCTREVLPHMLSNGFGNIINIASMYGVVSPNPEIYGSSGQNNPANYGVGKAAIIQFTKYLACHYGTRGIRANAISPGPFPNPKVQENEEFINNLSQKTALGRIGHPDELKGIIVMLASDASSYITGQNICVDGGWTAW